MTRRSDLFSNAVVLPGGYVNQGSVLKIGNLVVRPDDRAWPTVSRCLDQFPAGSVEVPRVRPFPIPGWIAHTWIPGVGLAEPLPRWVGRPSSLSDAVRTFGLLVRAGRGVVRQGDQWFCPAPEEYRGGGLVHPDPHPTNFVWRRKRPVAMIDFEFAHAGTEPWALATFVYHWLPIFSGVWPVVPDSVAHRLQVIMRGWSELGLTKKGWRSALSAYIVWRAILISQLAARGNAFAVDFAQSKLVASTLGDLDRSQRLLSIMKG